MLNAAKNFLFPIGSPARIIYGPLRGKKFMVTTNSGWSPIVDRWEPGAQRLYGKLIKTGDVVYDLGANAGLHAMLFSDLIGAIGKVFCFEPLQQNIDEINRNLMLNRILNATVIGLAVTDHSNGVEFQLADHRKQGRIVGRNGARSGVIALPSISLDEFVDDNNPAPDFIKMDVEGAEGNVLAGFLEGLRSSRPLMAIELHSPENDISVGNRLSDSDYMLFRFDPQRRSKLRLERVRMPRIGWPSRYGTWGTILAVPQERISEVAARVRIE